jgi:hypothetical protein
MRHHAEAEAVDRLARECADALALLEVLRRRPALWWLADATADRLLRLGAALDSARNGWPPG